MPPLVARVGLVVLAGLQALILLFRLPRCLHRAELIWFLLLIGVLAGRNVLAADVLLQVLSAYLLMWVLARYLAYVAGRERNSVWYLVLAALLVMHLVLGIMGLLATIPCLILSVFILVLLSCYPLWLLLELYKQSRFWLFLYFLAAAVLFVVVMGYEFLAAGIALPDFHVSFWLSLVVLLGTGHLLFEDAYLSGEGLQGLFARLVLQERRLRSTYSRLMQTESTLLLQDRLIAAGVLAACAVHEFKGTLANISAAAEFGLAARNEGDRKQSLALIKEQAGHGQRAAGEFLDRAVEKGNTEPVEIALRDDLKLVFKLLRSGLRREGIRLVFEIEAGCRLWARKGELEQVLLNLIRNASDNLKKKPEDQEKIIAIRAERIADRMILEVKDNGSGVPPELGNTIFDYSVSEHRSGGLGLYLSRILVERNGGNLEYVPQEEGSCFRMIFSPG
jgi:signal transduction histidine kinase